MKECVMKVFAGKSGSVNAPAGMTCHQRSAQRNILRTPYLRRRSQRAVRSFARDTRGAVLMEYVILGAALLTALVFVGDTLFDPTGAATGDFGLFGNAMMDWYHRIIDTVALPAP